MIRTGSFDEIQNGEYFKAAEPLSYRFQYEIGLGGYSTQCLKMDKSHILSRAGDRIANLLNFADKVPKKQQFQIFSDPADIPIPDLVHNAMKVNDHTGTDPEIFVVHGKIRKTLFPAFKFLPEQSKATPLAKYTTYGYERGPKATVYRDGFAAEMGIAHTHCHAYLVDHIQEGLVLVRDAAKKADPTAELTIRGTFPITKLAMSSGTDEQIALGCNPSFNAYGDIPQLPVDARKFGIRFAGGHVHFGGLGNFKEKNIVDMVKACDVLAGIPGVAIFADLDNAARRQFYGRAGEYRRPKHGLEYRVLSNAWLASPGIAHLMLNLTRIGTKIGAAGYLKHFNIEESRVRDIINNCDVAEARKWLSDKHELFYRLLYDDGAMGNVKAFKKIVEGGVVNIFPDFEDIAKNWKLDNPNGWMTHSGASNATWGSVCQKVQ